MKRLRALVKEHGYIIQPLLFALFPLLSFYGANAAELQSIDFSLGTFLAFNLVVAAISWLGCWLIMRDKRKASILSLLVLGIFFSFGRAHDRLGSFAINWPFLSLGPTKLLVLISLGLIVLGWFWLRKIKPEKINSINSTLTLVGAVIVASTLFSVVPALTSKSANLANNQPAQTRYTAKSKDLPDVYYLLFDGYARADFLKDKFGLDNSSFLNGLKKRGFYVAEKSHSNYTHTHFSMPSTFNMKYLDDLARQMGEESVDRAPLRKLLDNNEVVSIFKSLGYKYVQFGAQWGWAENSPQEDIEVKATANQESKILNLNLDEFALVYLQTTALKPWISKSLRNNLVAKILGAFEKAEAVSELDEPTLTYAHLVTPHPPYLFDRNGVVQGKTELELLNDGFSNRKGFADQTVYVNKLILNLVDKILQNSKQPPIIIIASDHGPASGLSRSDFLVTDPKKFDVAGISERLANLNTFYFPDQNYSRLYPAITPVNNFRVILSQYFGQKFKLLPDRSYFSNNKANEYRLFDVTNLIK